MRNIFRRRIALLVIINHPRIIQRRFPVVPLARIAARLPAVRPQPVGRECI